MLRMGQREYRDKVLGCWMGKNIGGTLGAPFEWKRQKNDVSFYTQPLDGNPLPNDDLDIQLLWLVALEERGIDLTAATLADYWMTYVTPHWSEYGIAKANMKAGLPPPLCGSAHNPYKNSCGAFIRSEIWACIAPGCPAVAARYAYEDAIIDHGDGEGMYAEIFCAALESAAFAERDLGALIEIGLSYIPEGCGVSRAARSVVANHRAGMGWEEARDDLLTHYRGQYATYAGIAPEDLDRGFADGPLGWDAPSNIGIVVLGLLHGAGDVGRSLCVAVNCGEDTDCTAATIGAILGITQGLAAIPPRWIEPIGRGIRTACLNLGELGFYGDQLPADIDALTDRVARVAAQVILTRRLPVTITPEDPPGPAAPEPRTLRASDHGASIHGWAGSAIHDFDFFRVIVDDGGDATIAAGVPKALRLVVENRYKTAEMLRLRWYGPDGLRVSPGRTATLFTPVAGSRVAEAAVEIALDEVGGTNRLVAELTVEGRATAMLVPVVLVQG